jgi:hypothetical protein
MSFNYIFTIHRASPVLTKTIISQVIPNCSELVFISNPFEDYDECFSEVTLLFNKLGGMLKTPQPPAVILHKLNPVLGAEAEGQVNGIVWDSSTVCKLFLADAGSLKKGSLIFNVQADIKYDGHITELASMFTNQEVEDKEDYAEQ